MNNRKLLDIPLEQYDSQYAASIRLIWPHLRFANRPNQPLSSGSLNDLRTGIETLSAVLDKHPGHKSNWATLWIKGKAHEAIGEFERSYECFAAAFELNATHLDVVRELTSSCLRTGRTSEAVRAASAARDLDPSNAGILANLAFCLFASDQLAEALLVGRHALSLGPSDPVTRSLVERIELAQASRKI